MTYIAPRVEALARAMCESLDYDSDKPMISGMRIEDNTGDVVPTYNGHWQMYRMQAQLWIYEHSGGELPEREGELV